MGECGCGEMTPDWVVQIGDKVMAIEVYPGCQDCGTGLMVALNLFTPERSKDFLLEPTEKFDVDEYGYGNYSIPVIGSEDLVEVVRDMEKNGDPLTDYDCLSDWLEDNALEILQKAQSIRMQKTRESEKKSNA